MVTSHSESRSVEKHDNANWIAEEKYLLNQDIVIIDVKMQSTVQKRKYIGKESC